MSNISIEMKGDIILTVIGELEIINTTLKFGNNSRIKVEGLID